MRLCPSAPSTKGNRVFAFTLRASTVVNWSGGSRHGRKWRSDRRDKDGNVLLMDADKVEHFVLGFNPRFHRSAADIVHLHMRAISDYLLGVFEPVSQPSKSRSDMALRSKFRRHGVESDVGESGKSDRTDDSVPDLPVPSEQPHVVWSIGNATFSHAHKGGPTFIGVKGLLHAGASLGRVRGFESTAVSMLEDMSSQLDVCCTRHITRPEGDYKKARCEHCKYETHRDINSAANMLRMLAYRLVFNGREECYKRRTVWEKSMMENGKMEKSIMMDLPRVMEMMETARQSIICLWPPLASKTCAKSLQSFAASATWRPSGRASCAASLARARRRAAARKGDGPHWTS